MNLLGLPMCTGPCHCLTNRPPFCILDPSTSSVRIFKSNQYHRHISVKFRNLRYYLPKASKKIWKFSCCLPQEPVSGYNIYSVNSENLTIGLDDDAKLDQLKVEDSNWLITVKEAVTRNHWKPWKVPWTAETILQVMFLWVSSFWLVGSWIIPFLAHVAGFSKGTLTYRGQALYSLLTDMAEGLAGIAILHRCLSRFRPLPAHWFSCSLKGHWLFDVVVACFMFPLVNRLSQFNINLFPAMPTTLVGASGVEQSIVARDPVAMALYAIVVSVCAPVWEEMLFRGFLLPSLTRYMPVWCSIFVSALAFALAHFNVQRLLPLVFLGMVMGVVFARTRNLLASIVLHSLWNGFVFLHLMK